MSSISVHIPATPEVAIGALVVEGELITAKEWTRAAIVAALVGPAPGRTGRPKVLSNADFMTVTDLAGHGIVGLSSTNTIERYRDAWCAIRPCPALGDVINLDGLPEWPPPPNRHIADEERAQAIEEQARADGAGPRAATSVAASPKAMAAAIKADPATARVAAEALASTRRGRLEVERQVRQAREEEHRESADPHYVEPKLPGSAVISMFDKIEVAITRVAEEVQGSDVTPEDRDEMLSAVERCHRMLDNLEVVVRSSGSVTDWALHQLIEDQS